MTRRTNLHHLDDMIEYGDRAVRYLGGLDLPGLCADPMRADALVRAIEVMGEACKRLSEDVKARYPAVPWRPIARMRDKLIHHYDGVDWPLIWETASVHVPAALEQLRTIRGAVAAQESPPEVPDA